MRIIAPMMILIMMTSTLAGCTGGDPDGGGNDEIDMDILNQLIDDNLQDFINNTTITVENHYHNNTTYVTNEYNNISNNEGDSVTENNFQTDYTNYSLGGIGNNSGSSDEILFVMHLEFNASEIAPELVPRVDVDPRLGMFDYTKSFYGFVWVEGDNGSNGWYEQQLINITHVIPCSMYYEFEGLYQVYIEDYGDIYLEDDGTFWGDYGDNQYDYRDYWGHIYGWNSSEDTSQMTNDDYYYAGLLNEDYCYPEWTSWVANQYSTNIGNIEVPYGYVVNGAIVEYSHLLDENYFDNDAYNETTGSPHSYYDSITFQRESGMNSSSSIQQYGGWDNLTVIINLNVQYLYENSDFAITIIYSFTPVIPVE
jgi:hypothetical protein